MHGSWVLTDHPTLAWPVVPKAASYRVEMLTGAEGREERLLWKAVTQETRLPYPEEEKVLKCGLKYRWRVIAQFSEDKEESIVSSKFFVLSEDQITDLARLKWLVAGDNPDDWLLAAVVYESYGAYNKALPLYEKLVKQWPEARNLHLALASYYEKAGRKDKAKEEREQAKKLGAKVEG
jgi:tetratricopeptide (TPR) repeat protein